MIAPFKTNSAKDFFTVGKTRSSFFAISQEPHPGCFTMKNKYPIQ